MKRAFGLFAVFAALSVAAVWILGGRAVAVEAVYPVERTLTGVVRDFRNRFRAVWSRQKIGPELARLRSQEELLALVRSDNARLAAENAKLRESLDYPKTLRGDWIVAPVLGRNGTEGVKSLMRVGKGSGDGVKKGAPVVAKDGVVGRVDEVSAHTALVRLLSDPAMRISCEVETSLEAGSIARGIVSGSGARRVFGDDTAGIVYFVPPYRLEHVRPDAVCKKGARVVTSGLGGVYPPGLAIGEIVDVAPYDEKRLECEGLVKPAVDFAGLENVFILEM